MDVVSRLFAFAGGLQAPDLNFIGQIVKGLYEFVGEYGWAVILFTVILKLITLPLDFWQRLSMKKNTLKMAKMQPMLEKIDKVYADDQNKANQEKLKLYKKQGYSTFASCLPTILTMVIFIVMFTGLNSYNAYVNVSDYLKLEQVYTEAFNEKHAELTAQGLSGEELSAKAIAYAKEKVGTYYQENHESFLWIKNIWRPDSWVEPMPTYQEFTQGSGIGSAGVGADKVNENVYNNIREGVLAKEPGYKLIGATGWNGLLILPILSIALSVFSTKLVSTTSRKKGEKPDPSDPMAGQQKVMMIFMPIMMGFFALMYTSAFAVYLVANSLITILTSLAINPIVDRMAQKQLAKDDKEEVSYRRK